MNSPRSNRRNRQSQTGNTQSNVRECNVNRRSVATLCALAPVLVLAGCAGTMGSEISQGVSGATAVSISGKVHGGQQPVTGSTIQLYTVGTSGLASASTPILTKTVTTDGTGSFSLAGTFDCTTTPATQVYITATGGNPGSGNNSALTMAAALGACTSITSGTFISINEVTTVAAAYALSPFSSDILHVGATGSNPIGLVNAFTNASVLANNSTGAVGGTLGAGVTVPVAEIDSLADIIASCVNTSGPGSGNCSTLFTATGASETFGATLAIAKNPGASAITSLYTLATPAAPFQPTLTSAPQDFTVAVSSTGNGTLASPYAVAIDGSGDAWVTNETGSIVTEIGVNAASLGTQTATGLIGAKGIAIDRTGNVLVANTAGNSVVKFAVSAGSVTGSSIFTPTGLDAPVAIALDSAGNAWLANFNSGSVSAVTSAGANLSGSPFSIGAFPGAIAVGPTGNIFVTTGGGSVVSLTNAGALSATLNDGTLQGPAGLAVDASSRVFASGFTTGSTVGGALSEYAANGTAAAVSPVSSGLANPAGVASDGASIWVVNSTSTGSLARFTYGASTPVSPLSGYGSLNTPVGVAIDSSGCVWTTNSGSNTVSKFIGLAAPVITPLALTVGP